MTKEIAKGKLASATGFANENRLLAALLSRGYNASKVDLPLSTYDLLVEEKEERDEWCRFPSVYDLLVKEKKKKEEEEEKYKHNIVFIRIQVKTVSDGSVSFTGGSRGGQDREEKSNIKHYTQNTKTSDVVVGVDVKKDNGDKEINFYFVPTLYIEKIKQKSLSIKKIPQAKNNWELMRKCKNPAFVYGFQWR